MPANKKPASKRAPKQRKLTTTETVEAQLPDAIHWLEQDVPIEKLKPYERNPREITEDEYENLKRSLQQDGYHQRIIATVNLRVIGGHQRIRALKELGFKTVKILTPDREIDAATFKRILIRDNLPFGRFDMDILGADFEIEELKEMGMPEDWLPKSISTAEGEDEEVRDNFEGFCVLVEFEHESDQEAFFEEMQKRGLKCKLMT